MNSDGALITVLPREQYPADYKMLPVTGEPVRCYTDVRALIVLAYTSDCCSIARTELVFRREQYLSLPVTVKVSC